MGADNEDKRLNLSQATKIGCGLVRKQIKLTGAAPSWASVERAARKVLRDDGETNPHPALVGGLTQSIMDWWDEDI